MLLCAAGPIQQPPANRTVTIRQLKQQKLIPRRQEQLHEPLRAGGLRVRGSRAPQAPRSPGASEASHG